MSPHRIPAIPLLLTALLIITSCKDVTDIRFTGVDNIKLRGMENNKINFTADVGVYNPSTVAFKVTEVNLKTIIDGNFIGTLTSDEKLRIKSKTDTSYTMNFSLDLANILSGASTLYGLSRKKQVTLEMQGYVKARSWLTVRKVDVNEKQVVDVPSMSR